ncbi:hypothetical protein [Paenibacillus polymyxa]|uniref:hypothetical protein n=1 Tax=Paenibacillus polymyxa TaxID=1406 RepID=UPI000737D486|nr:hypothetical protein [Paenibacillus polymyxa]
MKKVLTLFLLVISLTIVSACSSAKEEAATPTLDDYVKAYTEAGAIERGKLQFENGRASNGKILYLDNSPIQIMEYDTPEDAKKAQEEIFFLKKYSLKGNILLNTNNKEAKKIFDELK